MGAPRKAGRSGRYTSRSNATTGSGAQLARRRRERSSVWHERSRALAACERERAA